MEHINTVELEQHRMGHMHLWARKGYDRPRNIYGIEKKSSDALDTLLTDKALVRQETCWSPGCDKVCAYWVREVQFDMKNDKASVGEFRQVTSADYEGPVPGFCIGHIGSGPQQLAQAVYFSRPEMHWGFKPRRWFVIFTDGTKQGGDCIDLDPKQIQPDFIETQENIYASR